MSCPLQRFYCTFAAPDRVTRSISIPLDTDTENRPKDNQPAGRWVACVRTADVGARRVR